MLTIGMISPEGARSLNGSMIPTEYDLSKVFGYRPVMTGWVVGERLLNGAQGQLNDVTSEMRAMVERQESRENWRLGLTVLSTLAIVVIAGVAILRR